jgi:EAL domain-containing protein (putative c-di-GMP-specific phosphodiesterase class I)
LQRELAGAIERGELILEFQPQIDLGGSIIGAEALVRWNHPTRGVLAPGEFVPIAEMTGAISEINHWVFAESMAVLSRWRKASHLKELGLSLNVSVQQFRSPDFPERLAEILKASGIDGTRLTLELTEHAMARDSESVAERMRSLKKFGIRFSLDDFGTGYASLSLLNAFPFDEVKIDGAFVSQIEHRESNRTLIEAILGMANALGMDTVAEHVGNQHQLDFLRARGCSRFQGFHFYASMKEADLVALVDRQSETVQPKKTLAHVAAPSLEMLR